MTDTNTPQNLTNETKQTVMTDYVFMLSVPFAVAIFTYGVSAVFNVAISVFTCAFFTLLSKKFLKTEFPLKSPHSLVIGLSVALLLPATAPWWLLVLTSAFAMGVCVLPFGTPDNSPFIPSVAALCFATLCWNEDVYNYSKYGNSLGEMLLYGNSVDDNIVAVLEAIVGNVPSAMGTGCILALLGSLIFLVIRRWRDSLPVFSFILSACLMAIIFPRVATGRIISVVMELCSGMIFFGAIFFMSIPTFAPKRTLPKLLWGFVSGIVCMLIRYFSPLEESACFGFLIACAISDWFDNLPLTRKEKKAIRDLEPFVETVAETLTVVPDEILDKIPDISEEEIIQQSDKFKVIIDDLPVPESESLDAVISEENTVTEQDSPFITGGDNNE